jgi:hypothetical protein
MTNLEELITLDEKLLETLRALPAPGETWPRSALRAAELVDRGLLGDPGLEMLEACGLAENNQGWWRKTRAGVMYLRRVRAAETP